MEVLCCECETERDFFSFSYNILVPAVQRAKIHLSGCWSASKFSLETPAETEQA